MTLRYTLVLLTFLLFSCSSIEKEIQKTEAEVIRLHDVETMPKMGKLYSLSKKLTQLKDSLNLTDTDSLSIVPISNTIQKLNKAEDDMMNWMKAYGEQIQDIDEKSPNLQLEFYKKEVHKMNDLKQLMNESISSAQKILNK